MGVKFSNPNPAQGTPGRSGWVPLAYKNTLDQQPSPGAYPIVDGVPAGPTAPGASGDSTIGINWDGPQPITGAQSVGAGPFDPNGGQAKNPKPPTVDQYNFWWAQNQYGNGDPSGVKLVDAGVWHPAPRGYTGPVWEPEVYVPVNQPGTGISNILGAGFDFGKLIELIIMLRLLKALG